jgi:hypothetical protein
MHCNLKRKLKVIAYTHHVLQVISIEFFFFLLLYSTFLTFFFLRQSTASTVLVNEINASSLWLNYYHIKYKLLIRLLYTHALNFTSAKYASLNLIFNQTSDLIILIIIQLYCFTD